MKIYLNVLPEDKKKKARFQRIFEKVLNQEIAIFVIASVLLMLLGLLWYGLGYQLRNLENIAATIEETQQGYKELRSIEDGFEQVNDDTRLAEAVLDMHVSWTRSFQELSTVVPTGAHIESLAFAIDDISLIEGVAETRDILKELNKNLEENMCFEDVDVPTSAFAQKENVSFQIDFKINKDCL